MKRLFTVIAFLSVLLALAPPASAASPHFQKVTPGCHVSGYTVTCDGSDIAGVGNYNAQADLVVRVSAHVDCYNNGVNPQNPIESHEASTSSSASTGQLSPKNGRLLVPRLSATGNPNPASFPCPNPNWTAQLSNVRFSWSYTITFLTSPPRVFFSLAG